MKQPNKSSALTAYYHHVYYRRSEMDYFELIEMLENESRRKNVVKCDNQIQTMQSAIIRNKTKND